MDNIRQLTILDYIEMDGDEIMSEEEIDAFLDELDRRRAEAKAEKTDVVDLFR